MKPKAIITGGNGILGRELKKALGDYEVFLLDKVKADDVYEVDLTVEDEVKKATKEIGTVDLIIHAVGIMRRGDLFKTSSDYDLMFNINVKSNWLVMKHAKLKKDATVLFISSRHGLYLKKDPGLYSLTKHAQAGLAEVLRKTIPQKIKTAYPGPFDSPISKKNVSSADLEKKKKFIRGPDEIAGLILDLLKSDKDNLLFDEEKNSYEFL